MLLRVARLAHRRWRLALHGMCGADLMMTAGAGGRDRHVSLVRLVTIQTGDHRVHRHCGQSALCLLVAACTVTRQKRVERARGLGARAWASERVTIHAIGLHPGAEARLCLQFGVLDARTRSVAPRATNGGNRSH